MYGSTVVPFHPRSAQGRSAAGVVSVAGTVGDASLEAEVISLPVAVHGNRVIEPLDVPVGTVLTECLVYDPEGDDPGPLARALMAVHAADLR